MVNKDSSDAVAMEVYISLREYGITDVWDFITNWLFGLMNLYVFRVVTISGAAAYAVRGVIELHKKYRKGDEED